MKYFIVRPKAKPVRRNRRKSARKLLGLSMDRRPCAAGRLGGRARLRGHPCRTSLCTGRVRADPIRRQRLRAASAKAMSAGKQHNADAVQTDLKKPSSVLQTQMRAVIPNHPEFG